MGILANLSTTLGGKVNNYTRSLKYYACQVGEIAAARYMTRHLLSVPPFFIPPCYD